MSESYHEQQEKLYRRLASTTRDRSLRCRYLDLAAGHASRVQEPSTARVAAGRAPAKALG